MGRPAVTIRLAILAAMVCSFPAWFTEARPLHADNWLIGVHVCTARHYAAHSVSCIADDRRVDLRAFGGAWLSVSGLDGASFTSNRITLIVNQRTSSGDYELGRTDLNAGLSDNLFAVQLAPMFQAIGILPTIGTTFKVEIDETDGATQVLLGTATFTLVAAAAMPTPHLSLSCAAIDPSGNDPTNVECTLSGRGFRPHEALQMSYTTLVQNSQDIPVTTSIRRVGETDTRGTFRRPLLSFDQGAQYPGYTVTVTVSGAAGEWVTATATSGALAPDLSAPHLSFSCLAIDPVGNDPTNVDCILSGRGFPPSDTIQIVYTVTVQDSQDMPMTTIFRRSGTTDAAGAFKRPTFSFDQGAQYPGYTARVVVQGTAGERVTATAKGS